MTASLYVNSIQSGSITIPAGSTSNTATLSTPIVGNAIIFHNGQNPADTTISGSVVTAKIGFAGSAVTVYYTIVDAKSALVTSVQSGTIAMGTSATATATITSVDTTKSVVMHCGQYTGNISNLTLPKALVDVTLTNSTTVTASVNTAATTGGATVSYQVITFAAGVLNQNVQQFRFTSVAASISDTQTITSVNTNNAFIVNGGFSTAGTVSRNSFQDYVLTNSTTVTAAKGQNAAVSRTLSFAVVEFVSGVLSALQRGTIAITGTTSSATATISSIDTTLSITNMLGYTTPSSTVSLYQTAGAVALANSTTVNSTVNTLGANNVVSYEILTFKGITFNPSWAAEQLQKRGMVSIVMPQPKQKQTQLMLVFCLQQQTQFL